MTEQETKKALRANKKVKIKRGTHGWSAYFRNDENHFMIGNETGIAYRFRYEDPITGKISWSQWKNRHHDQLTTELIDLLVANINNLT